MPRATEKLSPVRGPGRLPGVPGLGLRPRQHPGAPGGAGASILRAASRRRDGLRRPDLQPQPLERLARSAARDAGCAGRRLPRSRSRTACRRSACASASCERSRRPRPPSSSSSSRRGGTPESSRCRSTGTRPPPGGPGPLRGGLSTSGAGASGGRCTRESPAVQRASGTPWSCSERIGSTTACEPSRIRRPWTLLVERRIPLGICPSSNLALMAYRSLERHPVEALRRAGVLVSLNTDDPSLLGTTLPEEYLALRGQARLDQRARPPGRGDDPSRPRSPTTT